MSAPLWEFRKGRLEVTQRIKVNYFLENGATATIFSESLCNLFPIVYKKNSKKCIPPVYAVGNINFREQTDFSFIVKNINRHPATWVISVSTRYFRIYYMFFVLILTIFNSAILYQIKSGSQTDSGFHFMQFLYHKILCKISY